MSELTEEQRQAMRRTMAQWAKPRPGPQELTPEEEANWPLCPIHGDYLQDDGTCDLCQEQFGDSRFFIGDRM